MTSAPERFAEREIQELLEVLGGNKCYEEMVRDAREQTGSGSPMLRLGSSLQDRGEHLLAIRVLVACISLHPETVFAYVRMGVSYHTLGDRTKALLCMTQAQLVFLMYEKATIRSAQGGSAAFPVVPLFQGILGGSYLPVTSSVPDSEELGEGIYNLGCTCIKHGYLDGAVTCFALATDMNPNDSRSHSNLGTCLAEEHRYASAVPHLLRALELSPADEISLCGLAVCFLVLDYPQFASPLAAKAVSLKPDYANARNVAAVSDSLLSIITLKEAEAELASALRLVALVCNPESRNALRVAEQLLGWQQDDSPSAGAAYVRGLGAALEMELRTEFFQPVMEQSPRLTLGAMASLLSAQCTNLVTGRSVPMPNHPAKTAKKIMEFYLLSQEDVRLTANCLVTMAHVRNAAAHGESVAAHDARLCRLVSRVCLQSKMRARLNRVLGQPLEYAWRLSRNGNLTIAVR